MLISIKLKSGYFLRGTCLIGNIAHFRLWKPPVSVEQDEWGINGLSNLKKNHSIQSTTIQSDQEMINE